MALQPPVIGITSAEISGSASPLSAMSELRQTLATVSERLPITALVTAVIPRKETHPRSTTDHTKLARHVLEHVAGLRIHHLGALDPVIKVNILSTGTINQSGDSLSIELVEPGNMPPLSCCAGRPSHRCAHRTRTPTSPPASCKSSLVQITVWKKL
jgi:hypothetical protein